MTNPIVSMIIACISTIIHLGLTLLTIIGLIGLNYALNNGEIPYDSPVYNSSGIMLILLIIASVVELITLLSSICLIVGIKKERLQLIVSWLYISAVYAVLSFVDFVGGYNALGFLFPIKVVIFLFHVAGWYPVFAFWRQKREKFVANFIG